MEDQPRLNPKSDSFRKWLDEAEECVRREPTKATVIAFGTGFLINFLPIRAIIASLAALLFAVMRPALLALGLLKALELLSHKNQTQSVIQYD